MAVRSIYISYSQIKTTKMKLRFKSSLISFYHLTLIFVINQMETIVIQISL